MERKRGSRKDYYTYHIIHELRLRVHNTTIVPKIIIGKHYGQTRRDPNSYTQSSINVLFAASSSDARPRARP